jgi:hypothetical protein
MIFSPFSPLSDCDLLNEGLFKRSPCALWQVEICSSGVDIRSQQGFFFLFLSVYDELRFKSILYIPHMTQMEIDDEAR